MQIGTVFASEKYVCPNAVGVDIGTRIHGLKLQPLCPMLSASQALHNRIARPHSAYSRLWQWLCPLPHASSRLRTTAAALCVVPFAATALFDCTLSATAVYPAGCGMCAVPFPGLHRDDLNLEKLTAIQQRLKQRIPTGFERHEAAPPLARQTLDEICHENPPSPWLEVEQSKPTSALQLGTLGGGNHFLEVRHSAWLLLPPLPAHLAAATNPVCSTGNYAVPFTRRFGRYILQGRRVFL